jgi:hypothetical protein
VTTLGTPLYEHITRLSMRSARHGPSGAITAADRGQSAAAGLGILGVLTASLMSAGAGEYAWLGFSGCDSLRLRSHEGMRLG